MLDNRPNDRRGTGFLTRDPQGRRNTPNGCKKERCAAYSKQETYHWAIEYGGKAIGNVIVVRSAKRRTDRAGLLSGACVWSRADARSGAAVAGYLFSSVGVNRPGIVRVLENPGAGRVVPNADWFVQGDKARIFQKRFREISRCFRVCDSPAGLDMRELAGQGEKAAGQARRRPFGERLQRQSEQTAFLRNSI